MVFVVCESILSPSHGHCLDLTHPSSEINKSPTPGIERELDWLHAYDHGYLGKSLMKILVRFDINYDGYFPIHIPFFQFATNMIAGYLNSP